MQDHQIQEPFPQADGQRLRTHAVSVSGLQRSGGKKEGGLAVRA